MDDLRLVVGLGNPGAQYARTRHNIGFIVVDALAERWGVSDWKTKDRARQLLVRDRRVVLVEPLSYMNESGIPTRIIASWYRIPSPRVLVVVDELDLPFGRLRVRERGSSGGHNGLKSLIGTMTEDFPRLRIGIGRGRAADAIDQVLGTFTAEEFAQMPAIVDAAVEAIERWLESGPVDAMNFANGWRAPTA